MIPDSLLTLLPVVSVLLAGWLCLPELLMLWRGVRIQNGFAEGPEDVTRFWMHNIDEDLGQQVAALGFQPVGIYWEKATLGRTFREFIFASPEDSGFAILYPNSQIGPRRATFLTVFTSGAVVFTKNYPGGVEAEEEDIIAGPTVLPPLPSPEASPPEAPRRSRALLLVHLALAVAVALLSVIEMEKQALVWLVLGGAAVLVLLVGTNARAPQEKPLPQPSQDQRAPLEEVLHEHRLRVARFLRLGHVPVEGNGQASFLEVQRLYHQHPVVRRMFRLALLGILFAKLFVLTLLPGLLAFYLGVTHPAPWACLLAVGLVMATVRYGLSSAGVLRLLRLGGNSSQPGERPAKTF